MSFKYPFLLKKLTKTNDFDALTKAVENRTYPIAVTGVSHIQRVVLSASLAANNGIKPIIITAGESENERVLEDLEALGLSVAVFPSKDFVFKSNISYSREYEHKRIGTLSKLLEGNFDVCVLSSEAAISATIPPEKLKIRSFTLTTGDRKSVV